MKINIKGSELARALAPCVGVVENNATLPILTHIVISVANGRLKVVGSDMETTVTSYCDAQIKGDESFTVPARKIAALITELPTENDVAINLASNAAMITSGKSRFKLQSLTGDKYPMPSTNDGLGEVSVNSHELGKALDQTLPSTAVNDIRYYLNGLLFEIRKEKLTVVSTDGHRLAVSEVPIQADFEATFILPRKAAGLVRKTLKTGDLVIIKHLENMVEFTVGDVSIISKLIEGSFPDWRRVVPKNKILAKVGVDAMQNAIRRALIVLADVKTKGATLTFGKNTVSIEAKNGGDDNEAADELDVDYAGEEIIINVNASYLSDALASINGTSVFAMSDEPNTAFTVRPNDSEFPLHVVMPMRL